MSPRTKTLLLDVAKQFDDASAVMHHDWLVENNVSADEICSLCSHLGLAIKGYCQAPRDIQMLILACGAADNPEMADAFTTVISRDHTMKSLLSKLESPAVTMRKPKTYVEKQRRMRQRGWDDFKAGKPITDFPGHGERQRAEWEIGWRGAKADEPKPYET
jgi:ribosome modulation factor